MKKIKPFTFFLFFITVLFLIFSPGIIKAGLSRDAASKKETSYEGILTVWQVNGWGTGGASITACLKKCIKEFENRNSYVFLDVTALTPAKAAEKLANGEKPDIISFPTGFFSDPTLFLPIEESAIPGAALADSARYRGRVYALPFLINPYLLYVNEELLFEKEVDESILGRMTAEELFRASEALSFMKQEGKKQKQVYGIALQPEYINSPYAALCFFREPKAGANALPPSADTAPGQKAFSIQASMTDGLALFSARQAGFLIASPGTGAALKNAKNTPPAFTELPFSSYSDMVQYIGAVKTGDALRENMCRKFLYTLYSEKNTLRLSQSGALPAVYDETLFVDDAVLKEAYCIYAQKGVYPNAFAYSALREGMAKDAFGAVSGDDGAMENIRRIVLNKLY